MEHTPGHRACPACEETRQAIMHTAGFAQYLFPQAAELWLQSRRKIGSKTQRYYRDYIKSLTHFFGTMRLCEIHIGNVAAYQRWRQDQIRATAQHHAAQRGPGFDPSDGGSRINHEVDCVLRQVLRHAGLWEEIAKFYEPLPLPKGDAGMALTPEEESHLFQLGSSRPRWMLSYCCSLISRNTTAGPGEIRYLRRCDVDLEEGVIHIEEGLKNEFRQRPVPLNTDALWAARELVKRCEKLCARSGIALSPEHYILPHRATRRDGPIDPTRPMGSWKKAFWAMRAAAAKKFPRLAHMRFYDFRRTACTQLLESPGVAFTTIEHMMGHRLGSRTKRKYDYLRNAALRAAAETLDQHHIDGNPPKKEPQRTCIPTRKTSAR
jgi:integrase